MMTLKNSSASMVLCLVFIVALMVVQINVSVLWKVELIHDKPSPTRHAVRRSVVNQGRLVKQRQRRPVTTSAITCNRSRWNYDICSVSAPTMLDPTTATFFLVEPLAAAQASSPEKIRPHPRKWEDFLMSRIREFSLTTDPTPGPCDVIQPVPALVFSAGGYVGNFFHEVNDIFIPLFITVRSIYAGSRDFILVIDSPTDQWVQKYGDLLAGFSQYPTIILNGNTPGKRHCFPSASVGLMSHGFMTINPQLIPTSATLSHFRELLGRSYDIGNTGDIAATNAGRAGERRRPRLVLALRRHGVGRVMLNHKEVRKVADAIGFEVVLFEPTTAMPLKEAYALINSSHALIGVHGAALTHLLFLRPRAVFVQVVPLGAEWASHACYGNPAMALGLDYIEYKVAVEESSLTKKYGRENRLVKDPTGSTGNGWGKREIMDIYLKEQNVRLDLARFGGVLKEAYVRAKKFMDVEG